MISVITPTYDRPQLLPLIYGCFARQTVAEKEWIVVDDSPEPSGFMLSLADPRVRYIHLPERVSTGRKRNMAVEMATGDVIAQFDDDDFYGPAYLETMTRCMADEGADFCKLASFFLYSRVLDQYAYWETQQKDGLAFVWSGDAETRIMDLEQMTEREDIHLGFGFSYVFKRAVWQAGPFADMFWNQDTPFIKAAMANGFKICLVNDNIGICLHLIHGANVSRSFPQYRIPRRLIPHFFPYFEQTYL